jgi:hypothetical protein
MEDRILLIETIHREVMDIVKLQFGESVMFADQETVRIHFTR